MKLKINKAWLDRKLAKADDSIAGASGTSFDEMKRNVERRVVTPSTIASAQSEIGKVVRFRREQCGLTRRELAVASNLIDEEIEAIECQRDYRPSLRAIIYLADALELSRERMKELAGYVARQNIPMPAAREHRFAASSNPVNSVSDEEYEAIRALVEVLAEKK